MLRAVFLSLVLTATLLGCLHGDVLWVRIASSTLVFVLYAITWWLAVTLSDEQKELDRKVKEER